MLQAYDTRHSIRTTPYPIQAIRFGNDVTLLALGGEVVVDYALRTKREYAGNLIVAGYSNDVMSYIPTARILQEGGYEPVDSMIYYGQPGPYADDVEERITDGIHKVMKRVGATRQ
jgi:neutral ceramidase